VAKDDQAAVTKQRPAEKADGQKYKKRPENQTAFGTEVKTSALFAERFSKRRGTAVATAIPRVELHQVSHKDTLCDHKE
jgi:hypothetical protein